MEDASEMASGRYRRGDVCFVIRFRASGCLSPMPVAVSPQERGKVVENMDCALSFPLEMSAFAWELDTNFLKTFFFFPERERV